MEYRQQSAIEFMSVYGLVLLIIAIVLALLVFISNVPRTILPTQCAYFNTFTCEDAVLSTNSTGSTLLVASVDSTPGIVNVSSFSAFIGSGNSKSGYCVPSQAQQGQTVYCVANFNFSLSTSTAYTGTFSIHANYCAGSPAAIVNESCPANNNYAFAGNIRIQPSNAKIGGINTSLSSGTGGAYVPITVTNSQTSAAPAHFQQMITFNPQTYSQYERSDLGNIRFYYGSKELYSWCENGCSTSSANAIFWIQMPVAIPSQGSRAIDMYFLPFTVQYDGIYAGEAPELTTPYAEYDNGAGVFSFYDNFAGTNLNTNKWTSLGTGYAINNGFEFESQGTAIDRSYVESINSFSAPIITEAYIYPTNVGWIGFSQLGTYSGGGVLFYFYPLQDGWEVYNNVNLLYYTGDDAENTYYVLTSQMLSSGESILNVNYNLVTITSSTGYYSNTNGNLYIGGNGGTGTMYWLRTRAYPPNGVMPTVTFGSITR